MNARPSHYYEFGPFRLDISEGLFLCDSQTVQLSPKAFDVLLVLVQNSGHVLEKEEMMKAVWPDVVVEEVNLAHHISVLRKVLGDDEEGKPYIETVPKRGYRFVASVREVRSDDRELQVEERTRSSILIEEAEDSLEQQESSLTDGGARSGKAKWWMKRRRLLLAVAGCLALVGLAAAAFYSWVANDSRPSVASTPIKTLAVLPFKPLAPDNRDESLELGMADTLISGISNIRQIVVRPIGTVRKYTSLQQDPITAGRELDVDTVLEGSIQRSGEQIRITARLLRVEDGVSLWADRFDLKVTGIFEVQDRISEKVVSALALRLSGEERALLAKRYTEDTEAYQLYIKGRYYWNQRTELSLKKGIEYFEQALEKDPDYALAFSGIGDSYTTLGYFSYLAPGEAFPKAKQAATRALEIDATLAEPHTSLAYARLYYDWDWAEAEKEFQRAIALNPNYPTAHHWYGVYLTAMGRFDDALAEMRQARDLDPTSLIINTDLGFSLYYSQRYDAAIKQLQTVLDMNRDFPLAHLWLGRAYQEKAMYQEAISEFQKAETVLRGWPVAIGGVGYVHGVSGNAGKAKECIDKLNALSNERYVTPYAVALVYTALGEKDQAFEWLHRAYKDRSHWLVWLKLDPRFNSLHSDPRFADFVRFIGLPQ